MERGLSTTWVEWTINAPDWTMPHTDPALTQSFKAVPAFGGRILKVVHRTVGSDILGVTAHFDRSAKR